MPILKFTATRSLALYQCFGCRFLNGEIKQVSDSKAAQLLKDFPDNFSVVEDGDKIAGNFVDAGSESAELGGNNMSKVQSESVGKKRKRDR